MPRLVTLGRFELLGAAAETRPAATQPKRLALLAYLAASGPGTFHRRDALVALLWPELGQEEARRALRQALHYLRRRVGEACIITRADDQTGLAEGCLESDVAEFERCVAEGRDADALAFYRGPFLDAVHIPDVSMEFEEWAHRTRAELALLATQAAWRLSESSERAGDGAAAVGAARRAHALSPNDEAGLRRLLELLHRMGDHAGALHAYDTFARRLTSEYGAAPSPETEAVIKKLRDVERPVDHSHAAAGETPLLPNAPTRGATQLTTGAGVPAVSSASAKLTRPTRRRSFVLLSVGALALLATARLVARDASTRDSAVLAVGWVESEPSDSMAETARVLRGLLATDLARVEGLAVVSASRLLEILAQRKADETPSAVADAARRAGATELLEGTLYKRGPHLRLVIRRSDLARGVVRNVYTADEPGPQSLVGNVTAQVARSLALVPPATPLAGSGTGSLTARVLYEQGLRTLHRGDAISAFDLFNAALAEDSTFAMAAYYASKTAPEGKHDSARVLMERAHRFAAHGTTRDRLLISLGRVFDQYALRVATAESLAALSPAEPDAPLELSQLRLGAGDFIGAIPLARRVLTMDSSAVLRRSHCWACEAYGVLVNAYLGIDSLAAEERVAREFTSRFPNSATAWVTLYGALARQRRPQEAHDALQRALALVPPRLATGMRAQVALFADDFAAAERLLRARLDEDGRDQDALWWLVFTLRQQGRLSEAADLARRVLNVHMDEAWIWHTAQIGFERGRYREAARAFDSTAHTSPRRLQKWPGTAARVRSWALTHTATAWAAAGDTARLAAIADSIDAVAHLSSYGRDWRLPHYVRGLLWQARGNHERAVEAFRAAIFSPTVGFTRTNLELARSLLALKRPDEAVRILRPALHGGLDASNLYVTRTELHELLGRAFEAAARPDSAAAHYQVVADSWAAADPPYRTRADSARARRRALSR